jgi:KaiC/GvpD/RAD55 family RecA-like ATPase
MTSQRPTTEGDRLVTGISKVLWCVPDGGRYTFAPARIKDVMADQSTDRLCWFDELFHGGILIPHGNNKRAVTMLITGPPGTGKSTLAMELCVRLALNRETNVVGNKTLYVASEAYPPWMIENARSFGWLAGSRSTPLFEVGPAPKHAPIGICTLSQVEAGHGFFFEELRDIFGLRKGDARSQGPPEYDVFDLAVIDSLNTVKTEKAQEFEKFHDKLVESGPRLIVFVLDSSPIHRVAETWEFASDIVLRLDKESCSGYMIRTIEVVKARYQSHVWGKHQLKIYESQQMVERLAEVPKLEVQEQRVRAHPYRSEGGIFIFPSIHYILSRYKRLPPPTLRSQIDTVPTPLSSLNGLLDGGIPFGRTTALVGDRGAHKSHLGYVQTLHNILSMDGKSLIISLRDDEVMTIRALSGILPQHWPDQKVTIDDLLKQGKLEIAYYMPGYITPDEFFHRMLLSIYRMREDNDTCPITLLFNSLDQIASRFPLCAQEKVFIPGIIQTLAAIGVTSVFVGADTDEPDEALRNLLSMAELIISVKRQRSFQKDRFIGMLPNASKDSVRKDGTREAELLPDTFLTTELTVVRYAGGKAAGSQGLLEFVAQNSALCRVLSPGLQFIPYLKLPAQQGDAVAQTAGQ